MAATDTILIDCAPIPSSVDPRDYTEHRFEGRPADAIDALIQHYGFRPWTGRIRETNDCAAFLATFEAFEAGDLDITADDITVPEPALDTGYVLVHRGTHVIGVITIYAHGTALLTEQARQFATRDPQLRITLAVDIPL